MKLAETTALVGYPGNAYADDGIVWAAHCLLEGHAPLSSIQSTRENVTVYGRTP